MTFRLPVSVAAVVLAVAGVAAGCGSSTPVTAGSAAARDALAGKVLDVIDGNGIPVADDHIACATSGNGRYTNCGGLTTTEPVARITGSFSAAAGPRPGHCPGTLTVTVGPPQAQLSGSGPVQTLAKIAEDPCR